MSCGICDGQLNPCPACHEYAAPKDQALPFEARLNARRHKGTQEAAYNSQNNEPTPVSFGFSSIDSPNSDRVGPKYSRAYNANYDGPGKGTW